MAMRGQEPGNDEKAEILRSCILFSSASKTTLERLAATSTFHTAPRGTTLFYTDDEPDGLRVVVKGLVRIWINDDQGRELTLELFEPGKAFGEMALLDGERRSANATVMESAEYLMVSKSAFEDLLHQDIHLARHLIDTLCQMLRRTNEYVQDLAFRGLGARLALKLIELSQVHAHVEGGSAVFQRKFSQTELGSMLGATREAVNKRMAVMAQEGLIHTENQWIMIPDLAALDAWARSDRRD